MHFSYRSTFSLSPIPLCDATLIWGMNEVGCLPRIDASHRDLLQGRRSNSQIKNLLSAVRVMLRDLSGSAKQYGRSLESRLPKDLPGVIV
jgi:hypothetical protein